MTEKPWDGVERRRGAGVPPPTSAPNGLDTNILNYIVGQFAMIDAKLDDIHNDMSVQKSETSQIRADVNEIKRAFPKDGGEPDYDGHHDHHDKLIKTSKKWSEIGTDVTKKLFGGVTWIVLCFVALAIWNEIVDRLHLGAANLPPPPK